MQFQALALKRFLAEGKDKRQVLEKKLSPFGYEDCESEKSCKTGQDLVNKVKAHV